MPVCPNDVHWSQCAQQVIDAINTAQTPQEAFAAAELWATRYKRLYEANAQNHWSVPESQQFEDAIRGEISGAIDQWTDPATIALNQAIERFFPTLAAVQGFLEHPVVVALQVFITPAPLANDFVAAGPTNGDVNQALKRKIEPILRPTWRDAYVESIQRSFQRVKNEALP